jgi:hypothetical protein
MNAIGSPKLIDPWNGGDPVQYMRLVQTAIDAKNFDGFEPELQPLMARIVAEFMSKTPSLAVVQVACEELLAVIAKMDTNPKQGVPGRETIDKPLVLH